MGFRALGKSGLTPPSVTKGFEIKTKLPVPVPMSLPEYTCGGSSVRFFHKFDESDAICGTPSGCGVRGQVNAAIKGTTLPGYLCTEFGVKTSAKAFGCDGMDYFSYTNMVNPIPCAEIILSQAYSLYPAGPGDVLEVIPWCR